MAGATSLVELILKKWGDDIAGAAKELEEKVGFPESVANRIATGELPMDAQSVAKRAQDQGYGDTLYHGSTHDIQSFTPSAGTLNDWGKGTYLTDSASDASTNYAGTHGADFQGKLKRTKKSLDLSDYEEFFGVDEIDDNLLTTKALDLLKGKNDGVVYPLRVKQEGLLSVTDEFPEEAWEEIGGIMGKYDIEGDIMPHEHQAQFVGRIIDENGSRMTPEEIAVLEKYAPQGHSGVVDTTTPERYSGMGAGNHTVIFPGNENQIRSVNAAFDPQYKGSNIMGGLALPAAAGLLASGQSEDADAGFVTRGGKTLLEAWHSGPNKIDGAFNLSDRDIGIHLADNEALATNAAVKSGFERGAGRDQMQTSPYFIDAGADQVYDISASSNRFDAVDIVDELVAAGKIDAERGSQMVDDILSMEDSAFDVNQYMRDNLEGASGIRALRYQNSFDAGPTWEDIERGVFESDVQPAPSYMVFNPDYIQKGNATVPMLATAAGLSGGGLLAASLAAPEVKDSGMISAPRSETLFDLTMGARDLERRLEGSPASLLFPSGLVEYLETVNRREEDPNAMTRGMALLDVLPF